MARTARLFELLQALRRRRRPVTAAVLAAELGVSLRTIYRDVATLAAQGAMIEGEAGLGYVLKADFFLPPLMFNEDEMDAVILGLGLASQRGDEDLAQAASDALAKIVAVLPPARADEATTSGLLVAAASGEPPHVAVIRRALHAEETLRLSYVDKQGRRSDRTVWPVAIGFFGAADVLAAWCETRRDFRHFRLDRIRAATLCGRRMPTRRRILMAQWRLQEDLD